MAVDKVCLGNSGSVLMCIVVNTEFTVFPLFFCDSQIPLINRMLKLMYVFFFFLISFDQFVVNLKFKLLLQVN